MSIAPKKRFSILERDGFVCKYCGGKPPFVQLEVDHIIPKSKGGNGKNYCEYYDSNPSEVSNIGKKKINAEDTNIWESKFILGGELCDRVLSEIYRYTNKSIDELISNEIIDDEIWTKEGKYNERLNYKLTEYWEGEFYIIKKYSLYPELYKNEIFDNN